MRNIWLDGMMGLVVGDALGNPVQFMSRDEVRTRGPVTDMEAGGVFETPAGTWTDDSSMALATLDSIREIGAVVPEDIMLNFVSWLCNGKYTPFGKAFDEGVTCVSAIRKFRQKPDWKTCGKTGEYANGNGALMRILPVCLHFIEKERLGDPVTVEEAVEAVHQVTLLTHNHRRAMMAGGLYYFMAREAAAGTGSLLERLQKGLDTGFAYYKQDAANLAEAARFGRLSDLSALSRVPEEEIRSSGYVVDTLEAAVWSLVGTASFRDCLTRAVNLGDDADTVGAVAGGLAGLFYGCEAIPEEWLLSLQKRDWIENMCSWNYQSSIPVIDIHEHLIPGIDDGSTDIQMTMEMIGSAYRQGVRGILCTPHDDGLFRTDELRDGWNEIKRMCAEKYPDLSLGLGCEIFLTPEFMDDCIEELRSGSAFSLNGTKYVLVEFSQEGQPFEEIRNCVLRLKEAGWIPVIAHAERYERSYRSIEDVRWLKEQGCRIQVNLYSLEADISPERKAFTKQMLLEKLVDFTGTDTHRMNHRPPKIANGMRFLMETVDPEYARKIAYQNARDLLGM